MKATLLLRKDHDTLRALIEQLRRPTRGTDRAAYLEQIRQEFRLHSQIERELFYPELRNSSSTKVQELTESAERQQDEINRLIDEVTEHSSGKRTEDQITALFEKAGEYLEFEEEEIFEDARQHLSEYKLEELGLEMEERRRMLGRAA